MEHEPKRKTECALHYDMRHELLYTHTHTETPKRCVYLQIFLIFIHVVQFQYMRMFYELQDRNFSLNLQRKTETKKNQQTGLDTTHRAEQIFTSRVYLHKITDRVSLTYTERAHNKALMTVITSDFTAFRKKKKMQWQSRSSLILSCPVMSN